MAETLEREGKGETPLLSVNHVKTYLNLSEVS